MNCIDKINQVLEEGHLNDNDGVDKLIAIAYYMGRESKAQECADKLAGLIGRMRDRANGCRYSRLANSIINDDMLERIGDREYIYDPDYSGNITIEYGFDDTSM